MFVLTLVEDKVRVAPEQFNRDLTEAVIELIEIKYLNKVLLNCGLCVSFYDIIEAGDPVVHPAEGEVLTGKIVSSTEKGLQVSLGFFDDLYVPQSLLMSNSTYDQKNGLWIWMFSTDGIAETDFPMELGAIIRVKVRRVEFTGATSTASKSLEKSEFEVEETQTQVRNSISNSAASENGTGETTVIAGAVNRQEQSLPPPMRVTACANEDGLGLMSWWDSPTEYAVAES